MSRRKPTHSGKRATQSGHTRGHVAYARALIRVAKSEGVRQLKLGEFECVLAADDETDAIGFETPSTESDYEPEETRRKRRRGA